MRPVQISSATHLTSTQLCASTFRNTGKILATCGPIMDVALST